MFVVTCLRGPTVWEALVFRRWFLAPLKGALLSHVSTNDASMCGPVDNLFLSILFSMNDVLINLIYVTVLTVCYRLLLIYNQSYLPIELS